MNDDELKIIGDETEKLLELLGVKAEKSVALDKDSGVRISLETEDTGLLIGYHGQTLFSLQFILNLILYKKLGRWENVTLNVGDWRQKREEQLKKMTLSLVERVEATGEPAACPYLSAAERRLVHMSLQDHSRVTTESEGEGENRRLIIKLKA